MEYLEEGAVALPRRSSVLDAVRAVDPYAAIAFAAPLGIFGASLGSQPQAWDTAEMQGVPYILGIAHPTGFPLYVILGWIFSHVVAIGTIAFRMNLLSAICVSVAALLLYRVSRLFGIPRACGLAAALWFCVADTVWTHAVRAEAHDLALALSAGAVFFLLRRQMQGEARDLLCGVACVGLAIATHPLAVWLLPGVALCMLLRRPDRATLLRSAAAFAAGVAVYLYLPLRSAYVDAHHLDPARGLAGVHGGLFWNYNNPSTLAGLAAELSGSQFGAGHTLLAAFSPVTLQGFLWSWLGFANNAYGAFALILAFIGLARLWSIDWKNTLLLLLLTLAVVPFSYAYGVETDSDRYRLLSLWVVPLLMSAAATGQVMRAGVVFALMALWGGETLVNNSGDFTKRYDGGGRLLLVEAALRIPKNSVVVTPWLDATSLAYGAYVDKSFPGRTIVAGWPADYARYYRLWIRGHRVYVLTGSVPAPSHGVRYRLVSQLDGSHQVYRVVAK